MDLQPLFSEPILEQRPLDPGYSNHASDVWLVRTAAESVVVRTSRLNGQPDNDFWWGLRDLFGVDPRRVFDMEPVNQILHQQSTIPVPRVFRRAVLDGRPYVMVELMPGSALDSFATLRLEVLIDLGEALARIHQYRFDWCGAPTGAVKHGLDQFHTQMVMTMRELVARFYPDHQQIRERLEPMCEAALALPAPTVGALVMPDIDPTQFLTDGARLTALVDTEAYVVGPAALDLLALEYVLDARQAQAFAQGYRRVSPLPDLTLVRPVYRYFYRLIRIQGSVPLDHWLAAPSLF